MKLFCEGDQVTFQGLRSKFRELIAVGKFHDEISDENPLGTYYQTLKWNPYELFFQKHLLQLKKF